MPRTGDEYSLPAGTAAVSSTTANSAHVNSRFSDLEAEQNLARPVSAGGTGATSAASALVNLGLTATAAELNILDGVTVTTAELNVLDGITATVTELNYVDGVTSAIQTQLDGKQASDATLTSLSGLTLAAGDILYATGADTLVNLAKGTAGQVLQMNSGATGPEWGTGSQRVLLATKTASASATLDFTEFNNAIYRRYEFELENVKPATDAVDLYIRTSTNGGSSYDAGASDYTWGMAGTLPGSPTSATSAGDAAITMNPTAKFGNAAAEYGASGLLHLTGAPSATAFTEMRGHWTYWSTAGAMVQISGGGARLSAADVDAVRFLFSSGNITSGTIHMYGVT